MYIINEKEIIFANAKEREIIINFLLKQKSFKTGDSYSGDYLNTCYIQKIKIYHYQNNTYLRIKDLARVLGVKQEFEFTNKIREIMGYGVILKGPCTACFRGPDDTSRTTFISLLAAYRMLQIPDFNDYILNHETKGLLKNEIKNSLTFQSKRSVITEVI